MTNDRIDAINMLIFRRAGFFPSQYRPRMVRAGTDAGPTLCREALVAQAGTPAADDSLT